MTEPKPSELDRLQEAIRAAPAPGGVALFPARGLMSAKRAQAIFVDAMALVMKEWHGRGAVDGRLRERERLAAILGHEAALRRRDRALELALGTDRTADEVVAELQAMPRAPEEAGAGADVRVLLEQLAAALAPLRSESEGFPYALASEQATFLCALTKGQLEAAREAHAAVERAISAVE